MSILNGSRTQQLAHIVLTAELERLQLRLERSWLGFKVSARTVAKYMHRQHRPGLS
jgi:hypothetical protein